MYSSGVIVVADRRPAAVLEPLPAALDDDRRPPCRRPRRARPRAARTRRSSLPSTSTSDVAGLELARSRRLRNDLLDDEQPGLLRIRRAHARLGVAREARAGAARRTACARIPSRSVPRGTGCLLGSSRAPPATRSSGRKKLDAACVFAPAFSATTRPSMSTTGEPDEPPDVPDAACR